MPGVLASSASWPSAASRAARLGVAGLLAALAVAIAGAALERTRLGATPDAGRARIAATLQGEVTTLAAALEALAAAVPVADTLLPAVGGDQAALKTLFAAVDGARSTADGTDTGLTVFSATGRPVAWSGRPSELPLERITGPGALFTHQSAAGLRLVFIRPVTGRDGTATRRLGSVAAERVLAPSEGIRAPVTEGYIVDTPIAPVSLRPALEVPDGARAADRITLSAPDGAPLLVASVPDADILAAHARMRARTNAAVISVVVLTFLLMTGPLLDLRATTPRMGTFAGATLGVAALIAAARLGALAAHPERWSADPLVTRTGGGWWGALMTAPLDLLLTALALVGWVVLAIGTADAWRRARRHRGGPRAAGAKVRFLVEQLAAGAGAAALVALYVAALGRLVRQTPVDLLHFSFHPWNAARIAADGALVASHAAVLLGAVAVLRFAMRRWALPAGHWRTTATLLPVWVAPGIAWAATGPALLGDAAAPYALAVVAAAALALLSPRVLARARHGSQFYRLTVGLSVLLLPSLIFYPALDRHTTGARRALVEQQFAPQAFHQRQIIQQQLARARAQIDHLPGLAEYADAAAPAGQPVPTEAALDIWKRTVLADFPLTSAIELYGADGALVSRFDFQLPEATSSNQRWEESGCTWDVFEEVSPFFSEERRLLHASRGLCDDAVSASGAPPALRGAIVVHVKLDYSNLPFISSQSPYVQLLRPADATQGEGVLGRDVEYVVFGWSRTPIYVSGVAAWPLSDDVFSRILATRAPFWTTLTRGGQPFDVYLQNDRGGIYALGMPLEPALGHLVNIAELAALVSVAYVLGLVAAALYTRTTRRVRSGRALLREIRESFYRKLFLAFVLASVVPVLTLAVVTRAYVVAEWQSSAENEAAKIAASARRVVEDYLSNEELRGGSAGARINDDLLVWISRLIDQDANIFQGPHLTATSERNLFAAGLLPTRTPGAVYREIALQQMPAYIGDEDIGGLPHMLAATPVRAHNIDAILTVPLTLRQQEIEREIDDLDRRVLLAALVFILMGAGLGYWMAERIADPVNRLTRATRRIARGDLDARILSSSHDELRRLVDAFNTMASDLRAQRAQLLRTERLEAWAEVARQVAHEIKNPLTPIQLSAEHLRRVHRDRGEPLTPVLEDCVDTILTQVRLLRQISSEFSSFASAPTVRLAAVSPHELVADIVEGYRRGLEERVTLAVDVPRDLPDVWIDRTLVARALTNIVENALHAMPQGGVLTVVGARDEATRQVRVSVADTGPGMDAEALDRAFEPYFSTKTTGTGLGLPLAKRNIELNGGTIAVRSVKDEGTTVTVTLPTIN